MHKFKISIKIFSLLASLSSLDIFSASLEAPDEETKRFFLSLSYSPSHMMGSSHPAPTMARQNSFDDFSKWLLDEPQGANFPTASSLSPLLPLGRTTSFDEILESMKNDSNSGLEASARTEEPSPCLAPMLLGKGPMDGAFSLLDEKDSEEHTSSASSHDSDEEEYFPPEWFTKTSKKAEKRALDEELEEKKDGLTSLKKPKVQAPKTSAADRKRERNKIASRETRKYRRNKIFILESLAEQNPDLKKQLNLIEKGLTPDLQQEKEQKDQEKASIPAKLKGLDKKQAVNAVTSRYFRKVTKAKLQLLEEYLAKHPEIDQASLALNERADVLPKGRPRKKIPTN